MPSSRLALFVMLPLLAGATLQTPDLPLQHIPAGPITLPPGREIPVSEFFIGRYEVSNATYAQCVDAGGCAPPTATALPDGTVYFGAAEFDNYPVLGISHEQAAAFCQWVGMRLPTAIEWQKAALWDPTTGQLRTYPWGETYTGDEANLAQPNAGPQPVDAFPNGRSAYHLYNMVGNAAEWVAEGELMGGSWQSLDAGTSAVEISGTAATSGFRCAYSCPDCETGTVDGASDTDAADAQPTATITYSGLTKDPVADYQDTELTGPARSPGAELVDLAAVGVELGGIWIPATGLELPANGRPWVAATDGMSYDDGTTLVAGDPIAADTVWARSTGLIGFPGGTLWVNSAEWSATFAPDETYIRSNVGLVSFVQSWSALPATRWELNGVTAELLPDRGSMVIVSSPASLDLYLITGTLALADARFEGPDNGQRALHIAVDPVTGQTTTENVSLERALEELPPDVYALRVVAQMVNPVAADATVAEQVWYTQLDLDGDPQTGFVAPDIAPQMYAGLGSDLTVRVGLDDEGQIDGYARFLTRAEVDGMLQSVLLDGVGMTITLDEARTTLVVTLSLPEMQARLGQLSNPLTETGAPVDIAFTPAALRWRITAINESVPEQAKDVYPGVDSVFLAPPDLASTPDGDTAPDTQAGAADDSDPALCTANTNIYANLRDGPGATYTVVTSVPARTQVQFMPNTSSNGWYYVELADGTAAWMSGDLLDNVLCPDEQSLR